MRFLILFLFLMSNAFADEIPRIKNLVVNKELKTYENITFLNSKGKLIKLSDYKSNLVILNFWATWCVPCKDEMPSLDSLKTNSSLSNLSLEDSVKIFEGKNFSEFKQKLSEILIEKIDPISKEIKKLINEEDFLNKILLEGHQKANNIASKKLKKLQEIVGF